MADAPKPVLKRFFEATAAILELHRGRQRLELIFENGYLVQWWVHTEKRAAHELAEFDEQAAWLVVRSGEL